MRWFFTIGYWFLRVLKVIAFWLILFFVFYFFWFVADHAHAIEVWSQNDDSGIENTGCPDQGSYCRIAWVYPFINNNYVLIFDTPLSLPTAGKLSSISLDMKFYDHNDNVCLNANPQPNIFMIIRTSAGDFTSAPVSCLDLPQVDWLEVDFDFSASNIDLSSVTIERITLGRDPLISTIFTWLSTAFTEIDPGKNFHFYNDHFSENYWPEMYINDESYTPSEDEIQWQGMNWWEGGTFGTTPQDLTSSTPPIGVTASSTWETCNKWFPTGGVFDPDWIPNGLCRVITFLIVPSPDSLNGFASSTARITSKKPFSYGYSFYGTVTTTLASVSWSSSSLPSLSVNVGSLNMPLLSFAWVTSTMANQFGALRLLLVASEWIAFGWACFVLFLHWHK